MFYLIYLITGFFAGIIGGLLGTGGCALIMPVIRFGFNFDLAIAVGTMLTTVVFTAVSGAYQHIKMKNIDKDTADNGCKRYFGGSLIGFLTSIIVLGGGYALVPAFIYSFKSPVKLAIGTSMASFVWMALIGAIFKIYQEVVNIPVAITLGMGAVVGAMYGAKLTKKIKPNILKAFFGFLFLYVSLKYIYNFDIN